MTATTYTLPELLAMPQEEVEDLGLEDFALSPAEVQRAGQVWLALLGIEDDGSRFAREVWADLVGDPALVVALHRPAVDFLVWFSVAADWETFNLSERAGGTAGGTAWARAAARRALRAARRMGAERAEVEPLARGDFEG
jgi:hypothetical protein